MTAVRSSSTASQTTVRDVTQSPYNAHGDGSANDTAAIQSAINDGGVTFFPANKIFKTTNLTAKAGTVLQGVNSGFISTPDAACSIIKLADATNTALLTIPAAAYNVNVFDMQLHGNKAGQTSGVSPVVNLVNVGSYEQTQFKLFRSFVRNGMGQGVLNGNSRGGTKIMESTIYNNSNSTDQNEGIRAQAADMMVKFCSIGANGGAGIGLASDIAQVLMNGIWGNNRGIEVYSTISGVTILGNGIDTNNRHGILVYTNCDGVAMIGNVFHSNSWTNAGFAHIRVQSTKGTVTALGNVSGTIDGGFTHVPTYLIEVDDTVVVQGWGNTFATGTAGALSNDVSRVQNVYNNTGTNAARPGVHTVPAGMIYKSNDVSSGTAYISDGSTWAPLAPALKHGDTHLTGGGDAITWGSVTLDTLGIPVGNINMNSHNVGSVGAVVMQGLTGATAGSRFVGATTSGAPVTGAFITGDFLISQDGHIWICTSGGSPGTWVSGG